MNQILQRSILFQGTPVSLQVDYRGYVWHVEAFVAKLPHVFGHRRYLLIQLIPFLLMSSLRHQVVHCFLVFFYFHHSSIVPLNLLSTSFHLLLPLLTLLQEPLHLCEYFLTLNNSRFRFPFLLQPP